MKIDVRFRALEPSTFLRKYTVRQVLCHIGRLGHEVGSVTVRLADVNGPRGGVDKQCHLTLRGDRIGVVSVDDLSADAYSAVDLAIHKASRAVARALQRARSSRVTTLRRVS